MILWLHLNGHVTAKGVPKNWALDQDLAYRTSESFQVPTSNDREETDWRDVRMQRLIRAQNWKRRDGTSELVQILKGMTIRQFVDQYHIPG